MKQMGFADSCITNKNDYSKMNDCVFTFVEIGIVGVAAIDHD